MEKQIETGQTSRSRSFRDSLLVVCEPHLQSASSPPNVAHHQKEVFLIKEKKRKEKKRKEKKRKGKKRKEKKRKEKKLPLNIHELASACWVECLHCTLGRSFLSVFPPLPPSHKAFVTPILNVRSEEEEREDVKRSA